MGEGLLLQEVALLVALKRELPRLHPAAVPLSRVLPELKLTVTPIVTTQ